jgi:hypothetical protein
MKTSVQRPGALGEHEREYCQRREQAVSLSHSMETAVANNAAAPYNKKMTPTHPSLQVASITNSAQSSLNN